MRRPRSRGSRALAREIRFVDGRASNPANMTKDNLQADLGDPQYAESVQIVSGAIGRSREFMDFAMPKHVAPPLLCRYEPGMKYGGPRRLGADPARQCAASLRSLVHGLRQRPVDLRGRRAVDRDRQPGHSDQGCRRRGDRLPVDDAARGRPGAIRASASSRSRSSRATSPTSTSVRRSTSSTRSPHSKGLTMKWESRVRLDVVRQNLIRMWSTTRTGQPTRRSSDVGDRGIRSREALEPRETLADLFAMVAARFAQDLRPHLRRVRVFGRLRIAREHGTAFDRRQVTRVGGRVRNDRECVPCCRGRSRGRRRSRSAMTRLGKPRDRFAAAPRLREPAHARSARRSTSHAAVPRGCVSHDCRRRMRSGPCPRRSIGEFCPASSVAR